jgi:hypothetical protein
MLYLKSMTCSGLAAVRKMRRLPFRISKRWAGFPATLPYGDYKGFCLLSNQNTGIQGAGIKIPILQATGINC